MEDAAISDHFTRRQHASPSAFSGERGWAAVWRPVRVALAFAAGLAAGAVLIGAVDWGAAIGAQAAPNAAHQHGASAKSAADERAPRPDPHSAPRSAPRPGPPLWRVSSDSGVLWLLGSAHLSSSAQAWRRPEVDAALAAADRVLLEAALEPDAEVRRRMRALGVGPEAFSLTARLSAGVRARLRRVAAAKGVDLEYLDRLRPWLASLTLRSAAHAPPGGEDIDSYIERQALMLNKPLFYLETWEAQIRVLAELPEASQLRLLERDLAALEAAAPDEDGLIEAWLAGDDTRLEALVFEDADRFPLYFDRLFARRNRAWAERFEQTLQQGGVSLAVVGAGHLYGPEGLLALLTRDGRQIQRW